MLEFLAGQTQLQVLELVSVGIPNVFNAMPKGLRHASVHDANHQLCTLRPICAIGRAPLFQCTGLAKAQGFVASHPDLQALGFDLDIHNGDLVSR